MIDSFSQYLIEKASVTKEDFAQVEKLLQHKTVEKGTFLLNEGSICQHTFFVEKGLLRAFTIDESGKEHIIQFAPENWFITDRTSVFFNQPSDFFIEAIEPTQVVLVSRQFIDELSLISSSFRAYNEKILQSHIRQLQKRINLLLGAKAKKRYLDFIELYPDITFRAPQWMIASYLGITPEGLSRVRKNLAQKNFKS